MNQKYVAVGRVADFIAGAAPVDVTAAVQAVDKNARERMLTRFVDLPGDSPLFASVLSKCTHRGCPVLTGDGVSGDAEKPIYDPATKVVTCPCHGSRFNVETGIVVRGPAKIALDRFDVRINNDFVEVAISPMPAQSLDALRLTAGSSFQETFPGLGKKYIFDFKVFIVEIVFDSLYQLTYTPLGKNGNKGVPETVQIEISKIRDQLFQVTWQEQDKTIVVHVEDYGAGLVYTNIVNPNLTLDKFQGTIREIS
jgi:nitrite reductase/ring-hydroxylating ferredoxin subunit